MTATVNGKLFRGVLFPPVSFQNSMILKDFALVLALHVIWTSFRPLCVNQGPGAIPRGPGSILSHNSSSLTSSQVPVAIAQPLPNSSHSEPPYKLSHQPIKNSIPGSGQSVRQAQVGRPFPIIRATSSSLPKEPSLRSDLQGVVLTLGGPGSSKSGS